MTTIYQTVESSWKQAMKDRNPLKDVFSAIKTEIKNQVISARTSGTAEIAPDDATSIAVLKKMRKQRLESISEFQRGNREDLVAKEQQELKVIESFLPQSLSAGEIETLVKEAVSESGATSAKDLGKVMKAAMAKIAGRADGKEVQAAVKAALGA